MKALAQHRGLFAVLLALIALGFISVIVLTARGGSPPRIVDWALLLWVCLLAGVTYALGGASDPNANG